MTRWGPGPGRVHGGAWSAQAAAVAAWIAALLAAPAAAGDTLRWGPGPKLSAPGSDFSLALIGYVQGDARSFRNWEAGDADTGLLRNETSEVRRLRIGIEGEWRRLSFQLQADTNDVGDHLKDAYLELRLAKRHRLRAGQFKLPVSREFLTSAGKIDFVERTMLGTDVGPARDVGVMLHGELGKRVEYLAGFFAGDGRTRHDRSEATAAARVVVTAARGLELAASFSQGDVEADQEVPGLDPLPKGFVGEGPSGFAYSVRRFVNGRRLRAGADAAWFAGPVAVKAEFIQGREERLGQGAVFDDLPEEVVNGWSVAATWLVTGEKKRGTIRPDQPLFRGLGAVEVGARYESLRFDDGGPDTGFAGAGNRARNIRPAGNRVLTGGVSWWPVAWVRVMGNVVVERYQDALLAPEPGRQGNYVTLLGRMQFQIP